MYTSSAAPWSGQGDCLPRTEHSELSSNAMKVGHTRGCLQICPTSRSADGWVGSDFPEVWFPTQHFISPVANLSLPDLFGPI